MTPLTARDLALIADALPWFARHLAGLAMRATNVATRQAYRVREDRAWEVEAKVRALHVAAVADEWLG